MRDLQDALADCADAVRAGREPDAALFAEIAGSYNLSSSLLERKFHESWSHGVGGRLAMRSRNEELARWVRKQFAAFGRGPK
jgi:hypothetical protein